MFTLSSMREFLALDIQYIIISLIDLETFIFDLAQQYMHAFQSIYIPYNYTLTFVICICLILSQQDYYISQNSFNNSIGAFSNWIQFIRLNNYDFKWPLFDSNIKKNIYCFQYKCFIHLYFFYLMSIRFPAAINLHKTNQDDSQEKNICNLLIFFQV